MSLLRASSGAVGEDADLSATVGKNVSETGVVHGDLLVRYAEAVHERGDIVGALDDIAEALGADAAYEAAITCAAFNGLVRVADGIGIQLDTGTEIQTRDARSELGLDDFGGADNTTPSKLTPEEAGMAGTTSVASMFSGSD